MWQLVEAVPDADVVVSLEPEELGAKLLFLLRAYPPQQPYNMFYPSSLIAEIWLSRNDGRPTYPRRREAEINVALTEAFA